MFCRQCGERLIDGIQFCPFCGTRVEAPGHLTRENDDIRRIQPAGAGKRTGRVSLWYEKEQLGSWQIDPEPELLVGRSRECQIVVRAPEVSRYHCRIHWEVMHQSYLICDLSRGGLFLPDGLRLPSGRLVPVRSGTKLLFPARSYYLLFH